MRHGTSIAALSIRMEDKKRVLLFGASGTIGQAVVKALRDANHSLTCVLRAVSGSPQELAECATCEADLSDQESVVTAFENDEFDVVISCIASRSGIPDDAWAVDYQANSNILKAAKANGVRHFILLSAICVQKPGLAFQHAKLAFEKELQESGLTYSIVRPTAFFKSLSGQIERIKAGKPYMLFGDGELTRCKPISDRDLAQYILGCIDDPGRQDRILPIGGPGPAITPLEQGEFLFKLSGKAPRYRRVPVAMMSVIIGLLNIASIVSKNAAAKAEYAKIGRYYATESMLVWDEQVQRYDAATTPEFGSDTLFDHYARMIRQP
jgi:divinyl chlorophyllide a 8-vinyl-reductase